MDLHSTFRIQSRLSPLIPPRAPLGLEFSAPWLSSFGVRQRDQGGGGVRCPSGMGAPWPGKASGKQDASAHRSLRQPEGGGSGEGSPEPCGAVCGARRPRAPPSSLGPRFPIGTPRSLGHNILLGLLRSLPLPGLCSYSECPPLTDLNVTRLQPLGQEGWHMSPWTVGINLWGNRPCSSLHSQVAASTGSPLWLLLILDF